MNDEKFLLKGLKEYSYIKAPPKVRVRIKDHKHTNKPNITTKRGKHKRKNKQLGTKEIKRNTSE